MQMNKETDGEDGVRYYHKRGKMLQIALFGLLFVAVGVYLAVIGFGPGAEHSVIGGIVGVLSLLLGLTGLCFGLFCSLRQAPALTLDKQGLTDRTAAFSAGFVAWSDISQIKPYMLMGQSFIGIELYEPESFVNRQGILRRSLMKANRGLVSTPVNIALQGFGPEAVEILAQIHRRWIQYGQPILSDQDDLRFGYGQEEPD